MANTGRTLTDAAWKRLLDAKGIDLNSAKFPILLRTSDLKTIGGREPRLMLSMDERRKWPNVLETHGVFPLSVGRTEVALVKGDPFYDFPPVKTPVTEHEARLPIRLVSAMLGQGENAHIVQLHMAGLLQAFLGGHELLPIASGKRHSPAFTVFVYGQRLTIESVQYEMDAQYESAEDVVPVEMKASRYGTCAIRQLYFPYRSLGEGIAWEKSVRPLYITYDATDKEYVVREIAFARRDVWESIHVVNASAVKLKRTEPPPNLLRPSGNLLESLRVPQADSAARIQQLPVAVKRGISNARVLAEYFGFSERQSSYYRDAAEMLGLIKSEMGSYSLTPEGRRFVDLPPQRQADRLASLMCRLPAVNAVVAEMARREEAGLAVSEVEAVVKQHARQHDEAVSGKTLGRRAQTIRAWLKFIGSRTGAIVSTKGRLTLRENVRRVDELWE